MTIKSIIAMVMLVFAIVIIFLFLTGPGRSILDRFGLITPDFETGEKQNQEKQTVGYNLDLNTVEYYDGLRWIEIRDTKEFKDKTLTSTNLNEDFSDNYYYDHYTSSTRKSVEVPLTGIGPRIYPDKIGYTQNFCIYIDPSQFKKENKGKLYLDLMTKETRNEQPICSISIVDRWGRFILEGDNTLKFLEINDRAFKNGGTLLLLSENHAKVVPKDSDIYATISDIGIQWRDSVLENPIKIRINQDEFEQFCVTKIKTKLVASLNNPSTICPRT